MKKILFTLLALLGFLNSQSQTMSLKETEEFYAKFDSAYKHREWEKVLQYCDTVDHYRLNFTYDIFKAEALAGLGRYDEGIDYLKQRFNNEEKLYFTTNMLGNIYWLKGDIENAIQHYEITITLRPTYARPYVSLGRLYQDIGEKDKSIAYFMDAIELFYNHDFLDEVEEFTKKIIFELDSTYIDAYIYLERTLHKKKRYREAMSFCADINDWCDDHPEESLIRLQNLYRGGENTFFLKDFKNSLGLFFDYLTVLKDNAAHNEDEWATYTFIGVIMEYAQDEQASAECYQKANGLNEVAANKLLKELRDFLKEK